MAYHYVSIVETCPPKPLSCSAQPGICDKHMFGGAEEGGDEDSKSNISHKLGFVPRSPKTTLSNAISGRTNHNLVLPLSTPPPGYFDLHSGAVFPVSRFIRQFHQLSP